MNSRVPASILVIGCLCCILNKCGIVEGRFFLEVKLFGYSNPTGRCWGCQSGQTNERGCCDLFTETACNDPRRPGLQCDSFFVYCLADQEGGCVSDTERRSEVNTDDRPLNFSQNSVLGLENPIIVLGESDSYTQARLRIVVTDEDPARGNPNDLIDILLIDHNLPVGQTSSRQNYTGVFDVSYVTMDLSIRVLCDSNYGGSDCSECVPGFTGEACNQNIDDCSGQTCSGNGRCVDEINSFTCECEPGFTGALCETDINDCEGVNCSEHRTCMDLVNSYVCDCIPGFTGQICETNINECEEVDCSEHGQCMDLINSFVCDCIPGYTGQLCEADINECETTNCSGQGQCIDGVSSFMCLCETGFTGKECEINIDDCLGISCNGNGQCVDGDASHTCRCDPGFTGADCEINIDDCIGVNCSGNGNCLDGVNSYTCECSTGFRGLLCTEEFQSSNHTGPIVGGVLGAVFSIILILILIISVLLIMRCQNKLGKAHTQDRKMNVNALPGDNPIYDGGDMSISLRGVPWTTLPVHSSLEGADSATNHREFDNPIYGRNEMENVYSNIDNHQTGTGTGTQPYHNFHNPIYTSGTDENLYSVPSNSSSLSADGKPTVTDVKQIVYENTNGHNKQTGREQVYDQII